MVKHKKKKSPPTPGPDKSEKKEPPTEKDKLPQDETKEPDTGSKDYRPPTEAPPPKEGAEKSEKESKLNALFWLRVGLAVAGGIMATFLFESFQGEERRWASIGLLIMIFIGSGIIAKGMKIPLPSSERKKIVTQGIGSYIFIYLFVWILSYTLVHVGGPDSGATSILSP